METNTINKELVSQLESLPIHNLYYLKNLSSTLIDLINSSVDMESFERIDEIQTISDLLNDNAQDFQNKFDKFYALFKSTGNLRNINTSDLKVVNG